MSKHSVLILLLAAALPSHAAETPARPNVATKHPGIVKELSGQIHSLPRLQP